MRKTGWRILILSLLIALVLSLTAEGKEEQLHWYLQRNDCHKPPVLPQDLALIRDYDGWYVNDDVPQGDKVIYLTFDAGYENGNIEKILDVLKQHDAQAAFFILSHLVTANTELVMRMENEGHLLCNHTANHKNMAKITDYDAFAKELLEMERVYTEATGKTLARFYRPPEGCFTEQNLSFAERMGYTTVFWSMAYADWDNNKQPNEQKAINLLMKHTHNGMILLLHPTSQTNADIMDRLLTMWEDEGYRFGSLEELK